jgi:hypothetical protein
VTFLENQELSITGFSPSTDSKSLLSNFPLRSNFDVNWQCVRTQAEILPDFSKIYVREKEKQQEDDFELMNYDW